MCSFINSRFHPVITYFEVAKLPRRAPHAEIFRQKQPLGRTRTRLHKVLFSSVVAMYAQQQSFSFHAAPDNKASATTPLSLFRWFTRQCLTFLHLPYLRGTCSFTTRGPLFFRCSAWRTRSAGGRCWSRDSNLQVVENPGDPLFVVSPVYSAFI